MLAPGVVPFQKTACWWVITKGHYMATSANNFSARAVPLEAMRLQCAGQYNIRTRAPLSASLKTPKFHAELFQNMSSNPTRHAAPAQLKENS
jgi:hypothetical protein